MSFSLVGYVVIEQPLSGLPKVIGKKWSKDYNKAVELAALENGMATSRSWVANKTGADPVLRHSLKEIVVAKDPKSKKARATK